MFGYALFHPQMFALCLTLAIGPPAALVALHYNEWFTRAPIDPLLAQGEVLFFEAN